MTPARSLLRSSPLLALALTMATGCEVDKLLGELDDTSATGSTGDGTGAPSSSSGPASGSGVAEDTSSGAPEGTSGGGETSSDTDGTAGAVCDPPPESLVINVDFEAEAIPESGELVVDASCVVQGMVENGDTRSYTVECDEDGVAAVHELVVRRSTGPIDLPLTVGTPIHLQVARNYPIDSGLYLHVVIRDAAGELVLGQRSGRTEPGLDVDVDAWFAPLEYALAFGDCEPEPYEDPGGSFIVDPCPGAETRLAVDFQLGDDAIHLLELTSGQLGPLSIFVTSARHHPPEEGCPLPVDRFSFVAYREA